MTSTRKIGAIDVRLLRSVAKLTQVEAAKLIGKSARCWQQWEAGDRTMSPELYDLFSIRAKRRIKV